MIIFLLFKVIFIKDYKYNNIINKSNKNINSKGKNFVFAYF